MNKRGFACAFDFLNLESETKLLMTLDFVCSKISLHIFDSASIFSAVHFTCALPHSPLSAEADGQMDPASGQDREASDWFFFNLMILLIDINGMHFFNFKYFPKLLVVDSLCRCIFVGIEDHSHCVFVFHHRFWIQ